MDNTLPGRREGCSALSDDLLGAGLVPRALPRAKSRAQFMARTALAQAGAPGQRLMARNHWSRRGLSPAYKKGSEPSPRHSQTRTQRETDTLSSHLRHSTPWELWHSLQVSWPCRPGCRVATCRGSLLIPCPPPPVNFSKFSPFRRSNCIFCSS